MKARNYFRLCFKTTGFFVLILILFGFNKNVKAQGSVSWEINWSGVTGPFRFESYCEPSETESWSVGGQGSIHYQSIKDGIFSQRIYRLPNEDYYGSFYGVWFNTNGIGWVVGDDGLIFHSTDNGYSWLQQPSGTTETLKAVTCTDTKNCWVLGNDQLLHTKNSGETWQTAAEIDGLALDFLDKKNGWVVADNFLYRTVDGGKSWKKTRIEADGNKTAFYNAINFIDKQTGWVSGYERVARTTDGGKTWKATKLEDANIVGIVAHDKKTILAVNQGEYNYCSNDAGKNWKKCFPYQTSEE